MRTVRLALVAACAATLLSGSALAQSQRSLSGPADLKPFLLRASEPASHDFPRTPSFSWAPVRGAMSYSFQLSKTPNFQDGTIFWASSALKGPAVAIPLTLPWMTGDPYAVYARVRAVTRAGVTGWSSAYGFNLTWQGEEGVPKQITSPTYQGLSRWTAVEGATSYQVWFTDINRVVESRVNAVDEREFYAFHPDASYTGTIHWRVRAVRRVAKLQGFITPVNYGPWSQTFTSRNSSLGHGVVHPVATVTAGATSTAGNPKAHEMTPAFVFSGTSDAKGNSYDFFRIYVFSDKQCVNPVFRSAIVASPAYAARNNGTLKLPTDTAGVDAASSTYLAPGDEGKSYTAEGLLAKAATEAGSASTSGSATGSSGSATGTPGGSDKATNSSWPQIELLESGWPNGRFYWTVVPVDLATKSSSDGSAASLTYIDAELPQDVCASGRVMTFGKASTPVVAGQGTPYASGLSTSGRLIASAGSGIFYGHPLVAWLPVAGADTYQVEWSHSRDPWRAVNRVEVDGGTAATLPLGPGNWWYRIRGVDSALPVGRQTMTWSQPLQLRVAKPKFRLVASAH